MSTLDPIVFDLYSRGTAFQSWGQLAEAAECFDRVLELQPEFPEARFDRAMIRLLHGDLVRGFADFEYRRKCKLFFKTENDYGCPRWHGEPIDGKTILLHMEQGIGDTIQFIRYAPMVQARGAGRILVTCRQPLDILSRCPSVDAVSQSPAKSFDVHAPLPSLAAIFGTSLETIPASVPYVFADEWLTGRWTNAINQVAADKFRIGICWQGSTLNTDDHNRSIPLSALEPLSRVPKAWLMVLQKGAGLEQLASHQFETAMFHGMDEERGAFADTAAAMHSLDLVVTADTAIAHLAGAMGIPCWIALSARPDWRWMLDRDDSPWYPSVRLFRQQKLGEWAPVFERMAGELRN